MLWQQVLLLVGVLACSTSPIFIKASHTHPIVVAAVRLLMAVAILSPVFFRDWRKHRATFTRDHLRRTHLPAAVLAAHLMSWTWGARLTVTVQASLIVNLAPIAIPFFLHSIVGEKINRTEIIGTILAVIGVLVLTARDAFAGGGDAWGNLVCFGSMLLFAWYLALGRKHRDFPTIWLYVVPVYLQAGLIAFVLSLPWVGSLASADLREWSLIAALACFPTILGHSLLNQAMRHFRGQIVSLCNVGQFVFSGIAAYFLFHEHPAPLFYIASTIVVAGIALVVFSAPTAPPRMR